MSFLSCPDLRTTSRILASSQYANVNLVGQIEFFGWVIILAGKPSPNRDPEWGLIVCIFPLFPLRCHYMVFIHIYDVCSRAWLLNSSYLAERTDLPTPFATKSSLKVNVTASIRIFHRKDKTAIEWIIWIAPDIVIQVIDFSINSPHVTSEWHYNKIVQLMP